MFWKKVGVENIINVGHMTGSFSVPQETDTTIGPIFNLYHFRRVMSKKTEKAKFFICIKGFAKSVFNH